IEQQDQCSVVMHLVPVQPDQAPSDHGAAIEVRRGYAHSDHDVTPPGRVRGIVSGLANRPAAGPQEDRLLSDRRSDSSNQMRNLGALVALPRLAASLTPPAVASKSRTRAGEANGTSDAASTGRTHEMHRQPLTGWRSRRGSGFRLFLTRSRDVRPATDIESATA